MAKGRAKRDTTEVPTSSESGLTRRTSLRQALARSLSDADGEERSG